MNNPLKNDKEWIDLIHNPMSKHVGYIFSAAIVLIYSIFEPYSESIIDRIVTSVFMFGILDFIFGLACVFVEHAFSKYRDSSDLIKHPSTSCIILTIVLLVIAILYI